MWPLGQPTKRELWQADTDLGHEMLGLISNHGELAELLCDWAQGKLLADGVLEQGGAALVAPYTGGESLRSPFNPWIFHVRAGYVDEAEHMVQQLTTLNMNRIAVMYQDDGFGQSGLEGVEGTTKIDIAGLMIKHIEDNVDMPKAKPKKKAKTKKK